MNHAMQVWFIIFVIAVLVSVAMQAAVLLAVLFGMTKLYVKVKQIEAKLLVHGAAIGEVTTKAREAVDILTRIGRDAADASDRIKRVVDEASAVSSKQLSRADQMADAMFAVAERLSGYVEVGVSQPVREFKAFSVGLRTAASLLFRREGGFRDAQRGSTFDHRKAG